MPGCTAEQLRSAMGAAENIRSMSVIAHIDHGKTTLADSLVARAGMISEGRAGQARFMQTRADENDRGVTIKSSGVSLYFEHDGGDGKGARPFLVNLVDSPGHVDFSSEVTAALRITDGALVVVDSIEGCAVQTETVLRQALQERVRPCLFVNKVDRCILELRMEPEDMYERFRRTIEDVNVIVATYGDALMGDAQVAPERGSVAFGSGRDGWGFSVERFAKFYAAKYRVDAGTWAKRLWGDWFYDEQRKTWTTVAEPGSGGSPLPRGFCRFVIAPISQLMRASMDDQREKYTKMIAGLGIVLKGDDRALTGKDLMRRAMQLWISAADALLSMIVVHLPSPKAAQQYRVENLYSGPMDDEAARAIRACDKGGPLMMYVSKMVPANDGGRFYAFGRVFSGTVKRGQRVRVQGPQYAPGSKTDLHVRNITQTVLLMGRATEQVAEVPCGNTVALAGVDQYLVKSGTLTDLEDAHNFTDMKYSVSPVVKVAVRVKERLDLPKLVEGLQKLAKSDQLVECRHEDTGENTIAGCGEMHLETCLRDLREVFAQCDFTVSEPVVTYRETVVNASSATCLAKSVNKLNRLRVAAAPMAEELCAAIEEGPAGPRADAKERARLLREQFEWDDSAARKLWCFGPDMDGANVLVDETVAVPYLSEAKEHVIGGFQGAAKEGPLCGESMRGVRFNLVDARLHADRVHRGDGQIVQTARRCFFAAELTARPALQEPVFLVDISCPQEAAGGVHSCMQLRRGVVFEDNPCEGTPMRQMKAHLPVAESFGFAAALRQATSGRAFPQTAFDHWATLPGDCLQEGSKAQALVLSIRRRKGMKVEMPKLGEYLDKL